MGLLIGMVHVKRRTFSISLQKMTCSPQERKRRGGENLQPAHPGHEGGRAVPPRTRLWLPRPREDVRGREVRLHGRHSAENEDLRW